LGYDGNHRVKTKFFSNDYLLAYEIGFKTKHQKKGWAGLWRKQKTDKMAARNYHKLTNQRFFHEKNIPNMRTLRIFIIFV